MELIESQCEKRGCKHYQGVKSTFENMVAAHVCNAFPNGIPDDIAFGENKHEKPEENQGNNIVFEEGEREDFEFYDVEERKKVLF